MPRNEARVQPPGGRRVGAVEVMRRLDAVGELLAEGRPRFVIVDDCCKRFGMSTRTCDEYIRRVREQWAAERAEGQPTGRDPRAPMPRNIAKVQPPGGRRVGAAEVMRRLDAVGELLAEGRPRSVIVADCRERFGMSARTCDDYIRRVREQWAAKRAEGRPTGRGPQAPTAPAPLALPASPLPGRRRSTDATHLIGAPQTSSADSHTRHCRKRRKVAYDGKSQLWLTLLATGAKSIWPEITDAAQGHKMPIKRAKEIATKLIITWRNHQSAVAAVSPVIEKLKKLERAIQDAREAIERADEVLYTDPQVETFATDVAEFAHHMGRAARQIMTHKGWTADGDIRGDTFPPKCRFPHGEIPGDIIREAKAVALKQMAEQGISIAPADQGMDRKPVALLAIRLTLDEFEERYEALQFSQIGQHAAPKHLEAFIEGALSSLPKNGRPSYHLAQNIAWLLQDAAEPGYPTETDEKVHVFLTENLADATSEIPTVRTIKHWRRKRPPLLQEYARLLEVRELLFSGRLGDGDPGGE